MYLLPFFLRREIKLSTFAVQIITITTVTDMKKFFDSEACLLTIIGLGFVAASVCTFIQLLGKPHVSLIGYYTVSLVGFLGLVSLFLAGVLWHDDKKYK